ncbi:MAG: amino acid ABC transporter permease [Acetobacteraceae bacterium]
MDWGVLWQYREALLDGFTVTVWVSVASICGSTLLGVTAGCLGTLPSLLLARLVGTYTEVLRNLPVIVKLFFFYFVVGLPVIPASVLALSLHQSAYIADVTAAGIRSVARGQLDASLSLGHSHAQAFLYVILPQVVRIVIPPMTTQYVSVVKNSSVAALISLQELTYQTQQINVETFRGFEAATAATLLYIAIALVVIGALAWLHRWLVA